MKPTLLLIMAALIACLVVPHNAHAQGTAENDKLRRRLTELENRIANLMKEVQSLRKQPATLIETQAKIYPLRQLDAEDLAKVLNEFYSGDLTNSVRIVGEPRTNSLLVRASVADHRKIADVIKQLDDAARVRKAALPAIPKKTVIQLKYAVAQQIIVVLTDIFGNHFEALPKINAIAVRADAKRIEQIRQIISVLDSNARIGGRTRFFRSGVDPRLVEKAIRAIHGKKPSKKK